MDVLFWIKKALGWDGIEMAWDYEICASGHDTIAGDTVNQYEYVHKTLYVKYFRLYEPRRVHCVLETFNISSCF